MRRRTSPKLTPSNVSVNPPEKSTCRFPEVLAPARRGPKHLQADLRLPHAGAQASVRTHWDRSDRPGGKVLVVHGSAVAEQIQQHDARKPHPVFRCGLDFRLVLVVHLAAQQLGGLFQRGDAFFQRAGCAAASESRLAASGWVPAVMRSPAVPSAVARSRRGTARLPSAIPPPRCAIRALRPEARGRGVMVIASVDCADCCADEGSAACVQPETLPASRNNPIALILPRGFGQRPTTDDQRLIRPGKLFLCFTIRLPEEISGRCRLASPVAAAGLRPGSPTPIATVRSEPSAAALTSLPSGSQTRARRR